MMCLVGPFYRPFSFFLNVGGHGIFDGPRKMEGIGDLRGRIEIKGRKRLCTC